MSNEPRRVFCKDCKHRVEEYGGDRCAAAEPDHFDPVHGPFQPSCSKVNKDMTCKMYETKRPWWAFWRRA